MKPLLVNTSDIHGGAARAAYRLHQGLQQIGIESKMLVQKKISSDVSVIGSKASIKGPQASRWNVTSVSRYLVDRLPLAYYDFHNFQQIDWSPQWLPNNIHQKINQINPDVVHFHWICQGFVSVQEIAKIRQPLVWTFHDMWTFTGGCHYNGTCDRYKQTCGKCPQLSSDREKDLSNWVWRRKKKYWKSLDFTVVTPSRWLADCARSSPLLEGKKIEVIPNGLNLENFRPVAKDEARKALNLPLDKHLVLFGAMNSLHDKRKGFQYIKSVTGLLDNSTFEAIVFGNSSEGDQLDIPVNYLGKVSDNLLNSVYSAADTFVAPSVQDNLPNTIMESLACGTPCVAFNIGGIPDLIVHLENGYLARPFDTEDLARGIEWVVEHEQRRKRLSKASRKYVEDNFELGAIAKKHAELYLKMY
jgi:glycosyltransferase involved in cell wall biosynthesis